MSDVQYQLPCGCGQHVVINATQAGQDVVCACGKTLAVPTLRGLQALTKVPGSAAATPAAGPKPIATSSVSGCLFALAFVTLVGCSLFTMAMLIQRSRLKPHRELAAMLDEGQQQVDELPLDESFMVWKHFVAEGIYGEMPTEEIVDWTRARMYRRLATGGGIAAGVALATMLGIGAATRFKKS